MEALHRPVMLREALEFLDLGRARVAVDATCGEGGHTAAMLERMRSDAVLLAVDRDSEVLKVAETRLGGDARLRLIQASYAELPRLLDARRFGRADALLVDLGVGSFQLGRPERGFSFDSTTLDMRYDRTGPGPTAADFLAGAAEEEIARVLYEFGEERRSRRIARAIVERRERSRMETGAELAALVQRVLGRRGRIHPATRTFQALRIFVNRELEHLERLLESLPDILSEGGRFVALSFHSIEDRLLKRALRGYAESKRMRLLTKKVVRPTAEEVRLNRRARSARLRAAEMLRCG